MSAKIFVNIPVKDLNRSIKFFTELGYSFNKQFTNEQAASMVISEHIYIMLLTEAFFQTFIKKAIADTTNSAEAIICLSADSREEVDTLVRRAIAAGASTPVDKQDHGYMYSHGFQDLDGHLWEIVYMDPNFVQPG